MEPVPTPPAAIAVRSQSMERATDASVAEPSDLHRSVVRAIARGRPLTGIVVLEYGLRYVVRALGRCVRRAMRFTAGSLLQERA